jgi:hypothetical protein
MSILVEAITVIFRNATADALIEGGVATIRDNPPNNTYRTDGVLSAVGFMTPEDTEHFVERLKDVGFRFIEKGKSMDIAVCDQNRGFTANCEWLGTNGQHLNNIKPRHLRCGIMQALLPNYNIIRDCSSVGSKRNNAE